MTARRPLAFVESWPAVLLMLATCITVAHCQHDDTPAAAPACTAPCGGLHGPLAATTTTAATTIAESTP